MTKAQAAMEYLITYGWAILIVIVVLAALYGAGFLTGPTCTPELIYPSGERLYVDDVIVKANGEVMIHAMNIGGGKIIINTNVGQETLEPNKDGTFTIDDTLTPSSVGECFSNKEFTITYTVVGGVTHQPKVKITGRYASGTDRTICQNAANGDLCDGLDIVYGEGYRETCCSEYGLCC